MNISNNRPPRLLPADPQFNIVEPHSLQEQQQNNDAENEPVDSRNSSVSDDYMDHGGDNDDGPDGLDSVNEGELAEPNRLITLRRSKRRDQSQIIMMI